MIVALALALLTPTAGQPCSTMLLLEAQRRGFPNLDVGIGERPVDLGGFVDSTTHPLRVHYGTSIDPTRADLVLAELEAAWAMQIDGAGFPEPLPDGTDGGDDRFDAYVIALPPGTGATTIALADASPDDGRHASPAFMKIDANLDDARLRAFTHHEFQHALQFAIDTSESFMWFESTAVFWEIRGAPDVEDWFSSLPSFQANPHAPIFADSFSFSRFSVTAERYEYGAVMFALYLDEEVDTGPTGTMLRELWEGTVQPDSVEENEPDWLDALEARASVEDVLQDFIGWRALVGTLESADDGPDETIPNTAEILAGGVNLDALDGREINTPDPQSPFQLGCIVREVDVPASVDVLPLRVDAEPVNDGRELAFAYLISSSNGVERAQPDSVPYELAAPADARVQLAFCDVTPADADADPEPQPIRFSLLRTDIEFPDAGFPEPDAGVPDVDAGVDVPPDPMCNCQSTGSPTNMRRGLMTLGLLVSFFVVLIRGRRMWKRKRLYKK